MEQREIKFRAWDEKDKKMIYDFNEDRGGMRSHGDNTDLYISYLDNNGILTVGYNGFSENRDFILMQYTGLKDKNGKDIYEDDIMKTTEQEVPYLVIHAKYGWAFQYRDERTILPMVNDLHSHLEIIGNIYENPELLK